MTQELRLCATARTRGASRLDEPQDAAPPDPSIAELRELVPSQRGAALLLAGGEPTLLSHLPELITALGPDVGLASDGLAMTRAAAVQPLVSAGLSWARIALHAARPDAHDWLVGRPGAARQAAKAITQLSALGVRVEIAATVTRPTAPLLAELIDLAQGLDVERLVLRRLTLRGGAATDAIALAPRMALLEPYLERAVALGVARKVTVRLEGFPACAAPRLAARFVAADAVRWVAPDTPAWTSYLAALAAPASDAGCGRCPGRPRCAGAPRDYVDRFGRDEFASERPSTTGATEKLAAADTNAIPPPPPRAGRAPATRLSSLNTVIGRELDGDPLADAPSRSAPKAVRVRFSAPSRVACAVCGDGAEPLETTRAARLKLVRAAQEGARTLRIASAGSLAHPAIGALLRETTLLSFEQIEVCGEASALAELSDAELFGVKGLSRFDVALYGPDATSHDAHVGRSGAFDAALAAAERVGRLTATECGVYAVLHDASAVEGYAEGFSVPRFGVRLSAQGASLGELGRRAARLPNEPCRSAFRDVLPPCVFARDEARSPRAEPGEAFETGLRPDRSVSGSDRIGQFSPCVCGDELSARCPGIALGWSLDGPR